MAILAGDLDTTPNGKLDQYRKDSRNPLSIPLSHEIPSEQNLTTRSPIAPDGPHRRKVPIDNQIAMPSNLVAFLLLVVRPGAPLVASLLLVAMPFAPSSF